jgi:hypothetical protein
MHPFDPRAPRTPFAPEPRCSWESSHWTATAFGASLVEMCRKYRVACFLEFVERMNEPGSLSVKVKPAGRHNALGAQ